MKNKLKPINPQRKPSSKTKNNNTREIIISKRDNNKILSNDFLPVK